MDSSDSEDDCYGNIAQKLQNMKNKFQKDQFDSVNIFNDSAEIFDKDVQIVDKNVKLDVDTSINSVNSDELSLDAIIASNSNRRVTRSVKRNSKGGESLEQLPKPARGRGTGRGRKETAPDSPVKPASKGKRRGRPSTRTTNSTITAPQSGGRTRSTNILTSIPTYSVGNTDEYPDLNDSQAIFSSKPNCIEIIDDNDSVDDNEELSVKVYWQSSEFFKFTVRRYQKISLIFDYFAKRENVSHDKLLFTYNERVLNIDDTPDSIDYKIVKYIDGGVTNRGVSQIGKTDKQTKKGIKLKFQCQNVKKPIDIVIGRDDKLLVGMTKCAEQLELPINRLKFYFDGDNVLGSSTPRELELEGDECIDVKIIS